MMVGAPGFGFLFAESRFSKETDHVSRADIGEFLGVKDL